MTETAEKIGARLAACGLACAPELPERLAVYLRLLTEWNAKMDLTAVTEEAEAVDRHLVDSLMPLAFPTLREAFTAKDASVIDVGTGAGFPGLALAMALPDTRFKLLDAQRKRLDFLAAVMAETGVKNVELIHMRAEDGARQPALRERFEIAVARAVAPLPVLAEYLLPYVKPEGMALCWKGPALREELERGARAAHILGGRVGEIIPAPIPGRDWEHLLLPIRKVKPTPKAYPRRSGTPGREPLG